MARHSGYDGSMTLTLSADTSIDVEVQRWELAMEQTEWDAVAKGDIFKQFQFGRKSWQAVCTFLVGIGVVTADHEIHGADVTALQLNYSGTRAVPIDYWKANTNAAGNVGKITGVSVSSPLDAPVAITVTIRGVADGATVEGDGLQTGMTFIAGAG